VTSVDAWRDLLVGQWWTPETDLNIVGAAATTRQATAAAWQHFSDQLHQELSGPLNPELQKGMTADTIRETFKWGANQAGDVAETNDVISKAHGSAHEWVTDLNSRLDTIAHDGKSRIQQIQNSKDLAPIKVGKIVEVVMECQQQANAAAAPCTQNIFEAIQTILDRRGIPKSARQFAQEQGLDTTHMLGSPNKETVTEQVKGILNGPAPPQAPAPESTQHGVGNLNQADALPPAGPPAAAPPAQGASGQPVGTGGQAGTFPPAAPPAAVGQGPQMQPVGNLNPGIPRPPAAPAGGPALPGPVAPSGLPAAGPSPMPTTAMPTTPGAPVVSAAGPSTGAPANNVLQGFEQGLQASAPVSGLNAPPPVTGPVEPQVPAGPTMSDVPASTNPSAAHAPVFDVPAATTDTTMAGAHTSATDSGTAYLAGPAAAATPAAAQPPVSAGPLPSYGADIRPPAPAVSPPTAPSAPPAAAPTSAPASPSAGAGGVAQPVIRQSTVVPTAHPTPAGVGEQAVVATAGGAAAGAASAQATAQARLQRLVDFVARQEPRLRWAAGDRPDGTTVLVTDLARGWIPPDIDIPAGMQLPDPARRRGGIESLLGEVTVTASYAPMHYVPSPDDDTDPVPASPRARQVPVIDELGWELGQATKWRDGLPRLAHTLAKAASTGTGVVDVEIDLLREQLGKIREQVLNSYPDDVDAAAVANWQLLASIDALATADNIGANYHFAWFQALNHGP
jgi:hypothetical protein